MKITVIIMLLAIVQCVVAWKLYFLNNRMFEQYKRYLSVNKEFDTEKNGRNKS